VQRKKEEYLQENYVVRSVWMGRMEGLYRKKILMID
jgi:hypothetical protein